MTKIQRFERELVRGINKFLRNGGTLEAGNFGAYERTEDKGATCCALSAAFPVNGSSDCDHPIDIASNKFGIDPIQINDFTVGFDTGTRGSTNYQRLGAKIRAKYGVVPGKAAL